MEIIGLIGAITGVASLIWHILKSRLKLSFDASFEKRDFSHLPNKPYEMIDVEMIIRNSGNCSTAVEEIWLTIDNKVDVKRYPKPIIISQNSSEKIEEHIEFKKEEFKEIFSGKEVLFEANIRHTHGRISKKGKTDFETGYFNL
jgi:hypothetical protein